MEKQYILNKQQYLKFKSAWNQKAADKRLDPRDHILYNLIRGKALNNGFTPTTKPNNIKGNNPWYAFNNALSSARFLIKGDSGYLETICGIPKEQELQILAQLESEQYK